MTDTKENMDTKCSAKSGSKSAESTPVTSSTSVGARSKSAGSKGKKSTGNKSAKGKGKGSSALQAAKLKGREGKKKQGEEQDELVDYMAQLLISEAPPAAPTGTGLVYDDRMTKHDCPFGSDMGKSESPQRITSCYDRLKEYKLVERCVPVPARAATEDEILTCHSKDYIAFMKSTATMPKDKLKEHYSGEKEQKEYLEFAQSTQTMTLEELKGQLTEADVEAISWNNNTYECARLALGGALELTEKVVKGELRNGMAVIRPPGHHAQKCCANGYCYFNNAAIAARIAKAKWNLERVLIVDWDIHHGQGVQYELYDDPSVLYFTMHRYDRRKYWPYLVESNWDHVGEGEGKGFNINVPWNHRDHGNAEYLAAFQQVLLPIAYEFEPELVIVVCGLDACLADQKFNPQLVLVCNGIDAGLGDPEGEMSVHPGFYAHLTHMLMGLANGKLVMLLEGGYNLKGLAEGVSMCTKTLLGDPCPPFEDIGKPYDCAIETVLEVISHQRPNWQCLEYQVPPKGPEQCSEVSSTTELSQLKEKNTKDEAKIQKLLEEVEGEEAIEIGNKLDSLITQLSQLKVSPHRTCLVYDERMKQHKPPFEHPERPERISRIYSRHKEWGLLDRCLVVEGRMATDEEILLSHDPNYLDETKDYANFSPRELLDFQDKYSSIYLHQSTGECARLALGCTLEVVNTVLSGKARNGVAIVRPPGHHAEYHTAMGFCFFNQVAVAAEYAKKNFGLKRVLILDWDIHHGNGTQHMFENDKDVLYMSLHRYDGGFFFPGGLGGMAEKVGTGEGEGFNVNVAWNGRSMGDAEYLAAFQQVIMPIAYEYNPELVLVSAGFDAAAGDPLGGYRITPEGFAHMTHMLSSLAQGKVVLALEGGYNLNSISQSMAYCTRTLLGDPIPPLKPGMPCTSALQSILETLHQHKKYWKCLQYQVALPKRESDVENVTSTTGKDTEGQESSHPETPKKKPELIQSEITETPKSRSSIGPMADNTVKEEPKDTDSGGVAMSTDENEDARVAGASSGADSTEELGAVGGAAAGAGSMTIGEMASGITLPSEETGLHAVIPKTWCEHLESDVKPMPEGGLDAKASCAECGDSRENWVCLHCYEVCCGRYINEHMIFHRIDTSHPLVLSYADLSVWCYVCDSYVHNEILIPAKRSAHISKFGEDDPGT